MHSTDITWANLAVGYLLMLIPLGIFYYYQTGLVKTTLIAVVRMGVQLYLVGLYLQYIFDLNSAWINLAWVVVMIVVASVTEIRRTHLNIHLFLWPIFLAMSISVFLIDIYFFKFVLKLDNLFDARYFIPITGMIIGNSMSSNIVAFNTYFHNLELSQTRYRFALANGATQSEALKSYIAEALRRAMTPSIASASIMGIISLPGMMTGQILGGANPATAIKYQIMVMICIIVCNVLTITLSIWLSNRFIFNSMGMLENNLLSQQPKE